MQYKKKDINDKILEAGRNEYYEKGFRSANISAIAAKSEVPVGNLYRYFDGKNGLLDAIVKPAYIEVPKIIRELAKIDEVTNTPLEEFAPQLTDQLLKLFDKYGKDILILSDKCATTRYEDFSDIVYTLIEELVTRKLFETPSEDDRLMAKVIARSFMASLFDLLRQNLERDRLTVMVNKTLLFYFYEIFKRC